MVVGDLFQGVKDKPAVNAFQRAVNRRAMPLFYPPLAVDGHFGPATRRAYEALGWALGLSEEDLALARIPASVLAVFSDPDARTDEQLVLARKRAPRLHVHTIGFDGTPVFWGLAKALLRARTAGWSGKLNAADRRKGIPEMFGKKSQATLYACFRRKKDTGVCPPQCGGDCNAANRPGQSSHELRSDGNPAFAPHKVGEPLEWWRLGLDVSAHDELLVYLKKLKYSAHNPYQGSSDETQHLNFRVDPGPLRVREGPNAVPYRKPPIAVPSTGVLKGLDVSKHQSDVDWDEVRATGRVFAYTRVTDGLGSPDAVFRKGARWKAMADAGLVRGGYHVARPQKGRDPRREVAEYLQVMKDSGGLKDGDLVPALDVEAFGKAGALSASDTLQWLREWVGELRSRIGRHPVIYTGVFWRETMQNPGDDLDCPLWLAAYVKDPKPFIPRAWSDRGITIWQHTETGTTDGIDGPVCHDKLLKGRTALDALRL